MHRIYSTLIELAAASVFIIPIFSLYGKFIFHHAKQTLLYIVFGFYLTAVLALVGFPNILYIKPDITINLVPFAGMISDFRNACLNILLFIPLGIFLPMLWEKYRNMKSALFVGLCTTAAIEISQIFTLRATDINDIITNIMGTLLGYLTIKAISKNFTKYIFIHTKSNDFYLISGTAVIIMFFLQPLVSSLLWELLL